MKTPTYLDARSMIIILLLPLLVSCDPDIKGTVAFSNLDTSWNKFRNNNKHNVQAVVLEKFEQDKSLVAIIAEPPANFNIRKFDDFMEDYNAHVESRTLKIGVNGWVKDLVMAVGGLEPDDIDEFTKGLNTLMYGSDYKSYHLPLQADLKPAAYLSGDHNLKISVPELRQWFLTDNEQFIVASTSTMSISEMLSKQTFGVFNSVKPGFVVWIIPRNGDIGSKRDEIRKFSLDSDLLLGAIAGYEQLALIGRERELSVIDLPPMRTETIQLLAFANDDQLSQSYERNNFLAGKITGGKDWAPIYLSDELIDTEYGSLLNITDQMLKSWSENGDVNYQNFTYTRPDYWAFNDGAITDMEASQLTYNWNTKGAVYAVQYEDFDFVALNRTGALPVSYFPESLPSDESHPLLTAEANAYNFFSNLNNPLLMRANQYAALYQIFSAYGVNSYPEVSQDEDEYVSSFPSVCPPNTYVIEEKIYSIFNTLITEDSARIYERIKAAVKRDSIYLLKGDFDEFERERYNFNGFLTYLMSVDKLDTLRQTLIDVNRYMGESGVRNVARYAAEPRGASQGYLTEVDQTLLSVAIYAIGLKDVLAKLYIDDIKTVFEKYIEEYIGCEHPSIKTPTAVLSWSSRDSLFMTGGHNIDSRIVHFKVDRSLKQGKFRIEEVGGVKTVLVGENDVGKITSSFLRTIEDSPITGIQSFKAETVPAAARLRDDVVSAAARHDRGFGRDHLQVTKTDMGYQIGDKTVGNCKEMIDELVAYSRDANMGDGPLRLTFKKFSTDEAEVIVKSADTRLATTGKLKAGNLFQITSHKYNFSEMTIQETENAIEVTIPARAYSTAGMGGGGGTSMKVYILNLFGELKTRAVGAVRNVQNSFKREAVPGSKDFYQEMRLELQKAGVGEENIILERNDCIICHLQVPNPLLNETWPEAA